MDDKPSPRRELQGPRPAPLKVRKDSHKIRKPPPGPSQPVAPLPHHPPQPRQPVIIYTVSPKVIHATASDFMNLVQRLTGPSPVSSPSSLHPPPPPPPEGQLSPAARFATLERAQSAAGYAPAVVGGDDVDNMMDQLDILVSAFNRGGSFPGILSPMPSSLPAISPSFFSPAADPNTLSFLHDLSPIFHGNRNYIENTFLSSPSSFISTPITSPTLAFDLFNYFPDL